VLVALDFDKTYDADPLMWDKVIETMNWFGDHTVILATYRHPVYDFHPYFEHLERMGVKVYCTDGKAKKPFLSQLGINVDIWIDDNPLSITQDSAWAPNSPELHAWREEQKAKLEDQTLKVAV
jgi:hypothetical protein